MECKLSVENTRLENALKEMEKRKDDFRDESRTKERNNTKWVDKYYDIIYKVLDLSNESYRINNLRKTDEDKAEK